MTSLTQTHCQYSRLVFDYVSGLISELVAEEFESHIEACVFCADKVMLAVKSQPEPAWAALAKAAGSESFPDYRSAIEAGRAALAGDLTHSDSSIESNSGLHTRSVSAPHSTVTAPDEDQQTSVRYSWLRRIGSGGMGDVWEGWDHLIHRSVALKRLGVRNSDIAGAQRLIQEATALARLSHPNIVTVFEVVTDHAQPVLVMEYIPGTTLARWQNGRPLLAVQAAEICHTLARALQHAHQNGVIHRDVKPSNVLLRCTTAAFLPRTENGLPDLRLSDFGVARLVDDPTLTTTGQLLGTPSYMAPEQVSDGKSVDAKTDVWGLGAILYELLTGRPPFTANDTALVLEMIRTRDPVPPGVLQPHLHKDIETICLKCLRRDPNERYATAQKAAEDLLAFVQNRPIIARPVSRLQVAFRWAMRNRILSALAALTVIAFTVAMVAAIMYAKSSQQKAELERKSRELIQTTLLDTIGIVDSYVRSVGEPGSPLTSPSPEIQNEAIECALRAYRDYVDGIDKSRVLTWRELDVVSRLLGLQRFTRKHEKTDEYLALVDRAMNHHKHAPEDPEQMLEFIRLRHGYFSLFTELDSLQTQCMSDWLYYSDIFLRLSNSGNLEPSMRDSLLRARRSAIAEALIALNLDPAAPAVRKNLLTIASAAAVSVPPIDKFSADSASSGWIAPIASNGSFPLSPQEYRKRTARADQLANTALDVYKRIAGEKDKIEPVAELQALTRLLKGQPDPPN